MSTLTPSRPTSRTHVIDTPRRPPGIDTEERRLVSALRRGDEAAFTALVERYHAPLIRLARTYVRDAAVAEEVVQDTWLGVMRGIDRFEGRSSVKTWLFTILTNIAKKRGAKERRSVPMSALAGANDGDLEADRFLADEHPWAGHWAQPPASWDGAPLERLLGGEVREIITKAIAALPDRQARVITLRDVEGWSAEETCALLGITDANQRVLLHRARTAVRACLERYLAPPGPEPTH
jgi:RNA polymerase sigma-70 factor (ECF subfamily)